MRAYRINCENAGVREPRTLLEVRECDNLLPGFLVSSTAVKRDLFRLRLIVLYTLASPRSQRRIERDSNRVIE